MKGLYGQQFIVDLSKNWCSCELWSLIGIPCVHDISALHMKCQNPHALVDAYYSIETFNKLYDHVLVPINGMDILPKGDMVQLHPPRAYKRIGRPRKARKRNIKERKDHGTRVRKRVTIQCENCGV